MGNNNFLSFETWFHMRSVPSLSQGFSLFPCFLVFCLFFFSPVPIPSLLIPSLPQACFLLSIFFLWSCVSLHLYSKIILKRSCSSFSSWLSLASGLYSLKWKALPGSAARNALMPKTTIKCSALWRKKEKVGIETSPWQPACPVTGVHVAEHGQDRAECNITAMGKDI